MSVTALPNAEPSSEHDGNPRLQAALVEFVDLSERGIPIDRETFLNQYADIKDELNRALDSLQLLAETRRQLLPVDSLGTLIYPQFPIGDFQLLRELGRGGMGVVYEALQRSLGRKVAVKVLPTVSSLQPKQRQRFLTEAKAAGLIRHPHVVPIYAVDQANGVHFYVMQFIEGRSLAKIIDSIRCITGQTACCEPKDETAEQLAAQALRGKSRNLKSSAAQPEKKGELSEAYFRALADWGIQVADGLMAAHELGIVHRDIKPANLLLDHSGQIWITDFGLARMQADQGLTLSGHLLGTIRYMSPEQALGSANEIDHRTDVYSLGVTLYELVTLEPAFAHDDSLVMRQRVIDAEPVRPRRRNRSIPVDLETVIMKAMAKEPSDRYASASKLADDLKRFLDGLPVLAKRPCWIDHLRKWLWRRRFGVAALTVAVISGAVGTLIWTNHQIRNSLVLATEERDHARNAAVDLIDLSEHLASVPREQTRQKEFLGKAQAVLERLEHTSGSNPESQFYLAKVLHKVAKVRYLTGDTQGTDQQLRRCAEILRGLIDKEPANGRYRRELADCYRVHCGVLTDLSRFSEALSQTRATLVEYKKLSAAAPDNGELSGLLADCYSGLGRQLYYGGRYDESQRELETATQIYQSLVERYPHDPQALIRLAGAIGWQGSFAQDTGQSVAAEAFFRKAVAIDERIEREYPERPDNRLYTLGGVMQLACFLRDQKRFEEAKPLYRKAIAGRHRLTELYPDHWDYLCLEATYHTEFGRMRLLSGKVAEAEAEYRVAIGIWERAISANLNPPVVRLQLAEALLSGPEGIRDPKRALVLADQSSRDIPTQGKSWRLMALAHLALGNGPGRRMALDKVLEVELRPEVRFECLCELIELCLNSQDQPAASQYFASAKKLSNDFPWLMKGWESKLRHLEAKAASP